MKNKLIPKLIKLENIKSDKIQPILNKQSSQLIKLNLIGQLFLSNVLIILHH
jgi:hypothetical protein